MHAIAFPKPHYTLDTYEADEPVEHETYRIDENDYGKAINASPEASFFMAFRAAYTENYSPGGSAKT